MPQMALKHDSQMAGYSVPRSCTCLRDVLSLKCKANKLKHHQPSQTSPNETS